MPVPPQVPLPFQMPPPHQLPGTAVELGVGDGIGVGIMVDDGVGTASTSAPSVSGVCAATDKTVTMAMTRRRDAVFPLM